MQIELFIDGENKIFTAPFVPMLAKRKYLELRAKDEAATFEELIQDDDAHVSILVDVIFKNQFTVEQVYEGASEEYVSSKLREAVFGIKKESNEEGNSPGE